MVDLKSEPGGGFPLGGHFRRVPQGTQLAHDASFIPVPRIAPMQGAQRIEHDHVADLPIVRIDKRGAR